MKWHLFTAELWLPQPPDEVFRFFANAWNLDALTPRWLNFEMLTPAPIVLQRDVLLDYRLRLRGIPFHWKSKITAWEPPNRFIDEQVRGPYRRWIHEHSFTAANGGTLCGDRVQYAVPGG